jgi:low affinity Fe/Cu permease
VAGAFFILETIRIPYGKNNFIDVSDVTREDVDCIIEQLESEAPHPGGRPTKYHDINLVQIEKLAERGWTDESIADFVGINRSTLHEYKKAYPLYEAAIGYTHPEEKIFCHKGSITRVETLKHYPPDVVAAIFVLCNKDKANWQHVQKIGLADDSGDKLTELISAMNSAAKTVKKQNE